MYLLFEFSGLKNIGTSQRLYDADVINTDIFLLHFWGHIVLVADLFRCNGLLSTLIQSLTASTQTAYRKLSQGPFQYRRSRISNTERMAQYLYRASFLTNISSTEMQNNYNANPNRFLNMVFIIQELKRWSTLCTSPSHDKAPLLSKIPERRLHPCTKQPPS